MVADQQPYLFLEIMVEQVRPRDGRRILTGCRHVAERQAGIDLRIA